MKKLAGWGALAVTLATVLPVGAQEVKSYTHTSETDVGAPQVIDSWMQPTVVKTTHAVDQDGQATTTEAPLVQERRERVMVPTEKTEETVSVKQAPAVTRTASSVNVSRSSARVYRPRRVAYHPRRIAYRDYNVTRRAAAASTQTASTTQMVKQERTTTTPIIYDRRDPALDAE
ncbi:MAG TPA: hypothetical protein V6C81_16615 [Planktothrix sp.]|jgi:hypothetical protein